MIVGEAIRATPVVVTTGGTLDASNTGELLFGQPRGLTTAVPMSQHNNQPRPHQPITQHLVPSVQQEAQQAHPILLSLNPPLLAPSSPAALAASSLPLRSPGPLCARQVSSPGLALIAHDCNQPRFRPGSYSPPSASSSGCPQSSYRLRWGIYREPFTGIPVALARVHRSMSTSYDQLIHLTPKYRLSGSFVAWL
ncbi:hypothetical protein CF326_g8789 [Tilletia indica]|nr:hypothetical protein CF326_g8789 [Tilletia indica]